MTFRVPIAAAAALLTLTVLAGCGQASASPEPTPTVTVTVAPTPAATPTEEPAEEEVDETAEAELALVANLRSDWPEAKQYETVELVDAAETVCVFDEFYAGDYSSPAAAKKALMNKLKLFGIKQERLRHAIMGEARINGGLCDTYY
jgi:ABC-type glycerol-3-phosphate transport system substrate-binding protein